MHNPKSSEVNVDTVKIIKKMTDNLKKLDIVAKTLEKESVECRNVCAGLKGIVREIDGAIRGKK